MLFISPSDFFKAEKSETIKIINEQEFFELIDEVGNSDAPSNPTKKPVEVSLSPIRLLLVCYSLSGTYTYII